MTPAYEYSYGRQNWFDYSAAEHARCATAVGLFDQTSFAKFELEGRDAEPSSNRICANDVAVPVGKIVYTQWLNENGGIEADLTVTRLDERRFLGLSAAADQRPMLRGGAGEPVLASVAVVVAGSMPAVANQFARSQPTTSPKRRRAAARRSCSDANGARRARSRAAGTASAWRRGARPPRACARAR